MIFTIRDASSIPWPAVREAYASSMHEVEEGRLTWGDATQWALNRLSASQVALVNSHTLLQQQKGRTCKFYNENSCNHKGHRGGDATQWALNRLLASQVALVNSHTLLQQQKGRTCKFHNENSCNHKGHRDIYKHSCAYC